jgi:Cu/Ag efflux pump CusA
MPALTTPLGLLPVIYATGRASETQLPPATVVLGGLATFVTLTRLILPALNLAMEERRARRTTAPANG